MKTLLRLLSNWWLEKKRGLHFGEVQCFRCQEWLKKTEAEKFVLCEDALGKMIEWYHPKCKRKMVLGYLAAGQSPSLGHISPFHQMSKQVIPEDIQKEAKQELDKMH